MLWTDIPSCPKDCPKLVQEWLSSSDLSNFDKPSYVAVWKTLGCEDFKGTSFSMLHLSVDASASAGRREVSKAAVLKKASHFWVDRSWNSRITVLVPDQGLGLNACHILSHLVTVSILTWCLFTSWSEIQ